ncbi:MAG TPA: type II secretion system protein [Patescibacteria group bacterium]
MNSEIRIRKLEFKKHHSAFSILHSQFSFGFTLIELLVVIAIFSVIGVVGTDLFTNLIKGSNKANVTSEVKQNSQLAIDLMERYIRNSTNATTDGSSLTLSVPEGTRIFSCVVPTATTNGKITLGDGLTANDVTNIDPLSGVDISSCSFAVTTPSVISPKVVSIAIVAQQAVKAPSRRDFQASVTISTTVSLRTY